MLLTLFLFFLSAAVIYFACEFFVNGVEWVGHRFALGATATGTVLAAFGTALPESAVTFMAVVFGDTPEQKDIGVGAAIGGRFAGFGIEPDDGRPRCGEVTDAAATSRTLPWDGSDSDLRHIDPQTGKVLERLDMPPGTDVSGLESDGHDRFFCGGGSSGKVRVVRRTRQGVR